MNVINYNLITYNSNGCHNTKIIENINSSYLHFEDYDKLSN